MEDNQLNFNRPLLSVRRFSPTVSSQKDSRRKNGSSLPTISPSPSFKSGPLRNAGSVPFVWEHSPGKPKDETKSQKHTKNLVPKLPPGRISRPKKQESLKFTEIESSKERKKEGLDSEVREIVNRKEVVRERPLDVKKVVNRENEKPQITYGPNFLQLGGDDSEEDSEFDDDEHENMSYKVCGLLPHFCLKGSIGLLNPLPGLSVRTRVPVSSANQNRTGSSSTKSQPARVAVYEHRSLAKQQKDETVLKSESTDATNQKNPQKSEQSGPYNNSQDRVVSNNIIDDERKEQLQKKGLISFKELLAVENEKESSPQNHMVEKTLYIDTIHKVETAKSDEGIFGISHIPTEPLLSDLLADESKPDKEMVIETEFFKDPKVEQDLKVNRESESELPAPPPLPKSPSDSWLWRTLPNVSSKTQSLRTNRKYPSSVTRAKPEKIELRNPQGLLLPIPES